MKQVQFHITFLKYTWWAWENIKKMMHTRQAFPCIGNSPARPLVKKYVQKYFFLFLDQNICCGYSKEPSQWDGSFEHPKYMINFMGKKILTILRAKILFT